MLFLRYFFYVLGAALLSAMVGGLFAAVVGFVSPDFVKGLFTPPPDASPIRFAAAMGMIWGVFIGAGVMGFCLGLVSLMHIARVLARKRSRDDEEL